MWKEKKRTGRNEIEGRKREEGMELREGRRGREEEGEEGKE